MFFFEKLKKFFNKKINNSYIYNNSTTKHSITSCCTLKLSSKTEQKKAEIDEKLKKIVKKYINNPQQIIQFIRMQGACVFKIKNAEKLLLNIGEEEGFITPLKGLKALYINFIFNKKLSFKTNEMFVFDEKSCELYTIVRALYKYYGFKNNLPGYDYQSQEIFKKVYSNRHNKINKATTINEIFACKEALARDLESINFTIALSVEHERAKKALNKIKETNSASI